MDMCFLVDEKFIMLIAVGNNMVIRTSFIQIWK